MNSTRKREHDRSAGDWAACRTTFVLEEASEDYFAVIGVRPDLQPRAGDASEGALEAGSAERVCAHASYPHRECQLRSARRPRPLPADPQTTRIRAQGGRCTSRALTSSRPAAPGLRSSTVLGGQIKTRSGQAAPDACAPPRL